MKEKNTENVLYLILSVLLISLLLGYFYRLKIIVLLIMLCVEAAAIPFWMKVKRKARKEKIRFTEANMYMEQILYSFRKNPKILSALKDVEKLFPNGNMRKCIQNAIEYMQETYGEDLLMEKALKIIETAYPAQRITYAHRLMLKVERLGGNCEASIRILLADRNVWEKETNTYQKRCSVQKRNIVLAILLSCLLCLMTPILCQSALQKVSITEHVFYQGSTLILFLCSIGIYLYTEKYFAKDWLQEKSYRSTKNILQKYEKIINYNAAKERIKSILWAMPIGIIMGISAICGYWKLTAGLCPVFIFLLLQHRVDYSLAKKAVVHEIRKAFPEWLMEVSLLLQTENVANSIRKSIEYAPDILKSELNFLVQKLESAPESNIPYSEFLQEFSIPEIASAMGMLYSISDGSGSDAIVQMGEILERNAEWMGNAESLSNQDKLAKMYLLFLLPALLGALKMMTDMTLILLAFFSEIHI
ncbi:MAG: hypothetical protein J6A75_06875 [Lachnospiraceae bacterium]|nr:hypothetical protein [Lachnospiraceae bacterium]